MSHPFRTVIAAAVSAALLSGQPLPVAAQTTQRSPSLLQQGMGAALRGRCLADVLTPELTQSAGALAALAPGAAARLAPAPDEIAQIALMCSQQVHQHRCSEKIVAVAGNLLGKQAPAGRALPPAANPGAVVGGTVGLIGGVLLGADRGTGSAVLGGALGAWGGAKAGAALYNRAVAASCVNEQARLDAISNRLLGTVSDFSYTGVLALIDNNRRARVIDAAEAAALSAEVSRLAGRADEVLQAAR